MVYTHHYRSPLGNMTVACRSDEEAIVGLWFDGQAHFGTTLSDRSEPLRLPIHLAAVDWLKIYFSGREPDFMPPLALDDSPFRLAVWTMLREIPWGQVTTYGDMARRLAEKLHTRVSAQAVGGAVGRNPISLMVPCHRVIGADGNLTGYAGGVHIKRRLLELEGVQTDGLRDPPLHTQHR